MYVKYGKHIIFYGIPRSLDGPSLVPKNYGYRKLRDWEESSMTSSSSSLGMASGRLTPGKAISVEDFKKALLPNLLQKSLPGKGQAEHLASEASSVAGSENPSEDLRGRRKAKSEDLHMRDLSQKIEVHILCMHSTLMYWRECVF